METNNYPVIDQFFAAQVSANESEATLQALRPQVETAVKVPRVQNPRAASDVLHLGAEHQSCHHVRPQSRHLHAATGTPEAHQ